MLHMILSYMKIDIEEAIEIPNIKKIRLKNLKQEPFIYLNCNIDINNTSKAA